MNLVLDCFVPLTVARLRPSAIPTPNALFRLPGNELTLDQIQAAGGTSRHEAEALVSLLVQLGFLQRRPDLSTSHPVVKTYNPVRLSQ